MSPLLNKRALLKLGWTPALISAILDKPDKIEHHKKGLCHWVEHLYARDRVEQGMQDSRFLASGEKRRQSAQKAEARRRDIPAQYPTWKAALPDVAAGMFSLNRYAKHRQCSQIHKVEIYQLKNDLIELLHEHGYCTASWLHPMVQRCRECNGIPGDCEHCGGSGIWRTVELWCFRFLIEGRTYCWHQPRASVNFAPVESLPPHSWPGIAIEKPIVLPPRRFAAVKTLCRWVLEDAATAAHKETPDSFPFVFRSEVFDSPFSGHQVPLIPPR